MRSKEFHFPLSVDWTGGRNVRVKVPDKPALGVAPPPVFKGTDPTVWSPEDLFVAAAASCLAITFTGLAEREHLPLHRLEVGGDGVAGRRPDGRFGFTQVTLRLELETDPGDEGRALAIARKAEEACLVSASLDLSVETVIDVRAAVAA